jgi:hypothetical protein
LRTAGRGSSDVKSLPEGVSSSRCYPLPLGGRHRLERSESFKYLLFVGPVSILGAPPAESVGRPENVRNRSRTYLEVRLLEPRSCTSRRSLPGVWTLRSTPASRPSHHRLSSDRLWPPTPVHTELCGCRIPRGHLRPRTPGMALVLYESPAGMNSYNRGCLARCS